MVVRGVARGICQALLATRQSDKNITYTVGKDQRSIFRHPLTSIPSRNYKEVEARISDAIEKAEY